MLNLSGVVQPELFLESSGIVDRCDVDDWLGLSKVVFAE